MTVERFYVQSGEAKMELRMTTAVQVDEAMAMAAAAGLEADPRHVRNPARNGHSFWSVTLVSGGHDIVDSMAAMLLVAAKVRNTTAEELIEEVRRGTDFERQTAAAVPSVH